MYLPLKGTDQPDYGWRLIGEPYAFFLTSFEKMRTKKKPFCRGRAIIAHSEHAVKSFFHFFVFFSRFSFHYLYASAIEKEKDPPSFQGKVLGY